ncbi:MAG TPA: TIR domain-containing protein, partial [Thermoanaerobaculia bacterium]|nr:TIR domain-containing protein [Thermoanaerobaculia bacterium]
MTWQAVIAHAPGEEELAEKLAHPIREAGYEVTYRGTVLVGESFIEEAAKALSAGGPVILCGTVEALGTGWAHHLVNSARANFGRRRFFPVRMQERAYIEQIAPGTAVAEYWRDPERGVQELLRALREYFPIEPQGSPSRAEAPPLAFLDRLTGLARFNAESLASFRAELRPSSTGTLPLSLEPVEFLQRASLMRNGVLTMTGVLLFGYTPTDVLPSAFARFVVYTGATKTADREPMDCRGTIIQQITELYHQIASRIRARERVGTDSPRTEVIYEYPMRTVREIIANALVHRDYEDPGRFVHVRLFTDRIEILSPGEWVG